MKRKVRITTVPSEIAGYRLLRARLVKLGLPVETAEAQAREAAQTFRYETRRGRNASAVFSWPRAYQIAERLGACPSL